MTMIRWPQRNTHATITKLVTDTLTNLGWIGPGLLGSPSVTVINFDPQQAAEAIVPNTVAVTIPNEGNDVPMELGAGMREVPYTVFIDIFPSNDSVGQALSDDIKLPLVDGYFPLLDFSQTPPSAVPGAYIEIEHIVGNRFPQGTGVGKQTWRDLRLTAQLQYMP